MNNRNEVVGHVFRRRLPSGAIPGPMDAFLWDAVWDEGCVSILGPGGHVGGFNITPNTADPDDYYYGTPDGRVSNRKTTDIISFRDMNRHGVMLGSGFATQFVFAGETVTALVRAPTSTGGTVGRFVAVAINDQGYIAGFREVFGVLRGVRLVPVPSAPSPLTFTVTDRTVSLNWQASRDALHYVIEAGSASGVADLFYASIGARKKSDSSATSTS